jgi:putative lipoprotein
MTVGAVLAASIAASLASSVLPPAAAPGDGWLGVDKIKHFLVAAFTQSVAYSVLQASGVSHRGALAGAWTTTAALSVGKELYDGRTTGVFSVRDLVWDAAGAGAATLLIDRTRRRDDSADSQTAAAALHAGTPVARSYIAGTFRRRAAHAVLQPFPHERPARQLREGAP